MKKSTKIIIAVVIGLFILILCLPIGHNENDANKNDNNKAVEPVKNNTDLKVSVANVTKSKDYDNRPVLLITYDYENIKREDPISFIIAFDDKAYQNGVELNPAILGKNYQSFDKDGNSSKDLQIGAKIQVTKAYILNDNTTEVKLEVKNLLGTLDEVTFIKDTIDLSRIK